MSETNCDHNCGSCGETCDERQVPESLKVKPHALSSVRHVAAVISGKGGVGKSLVTSLTAVALSRAGFHVGILDADITGPSIPKAFGVSGQLRGSESGAYPIPSDGGIDIMSINLLLQNDTDPVLWRGPIISGMVRQFWQDIIWQDIDYLLVDMPPGTGDVPLTIFQSLPLDGILVVTSPQDLVSMIVSKAVNMAKMMDIPILGIIENMASFRCPDCGKEHLIFGESRLPSIAAQYGIPVLGHIPIDPRLAAACDAGEIETFETHWLDSAVEALKALDAKNQA
ncbi:MAG: Mrp/NBP35 family ATP-binding protein [Schwartzia sp.]|nr:Mrp/NBP35 family ATP-binding protein [Schwartzia sp. (in: firmicutes)]